VNSSGEAEHDVPRRAEDLQSLCLWGGSDAAANPIDYLDMLFVSK
jgi:hypothetical protein